MSSPSWPLDPDARPSVARMYDYLLGGHHNFPADRAAAEQMVALMPDFPLIMAANRAFLRRAVTFLLSEGITQFLDIGSGIPTVGNVHEVAQAARPDARVVYVDIDPVAVTHSAALLAGNPDAAFIRADARQPDQILGHPDVRGMLDFREPIGVLLVAFLHFVPDDDEATQIVQRLSDATAPGSYVAISHAIHTYATDVEGRGVEVYGRSNTPITLRSPERVRRFYEPLELVEPGLVPIPLWRPEGSDDIFLNDPARSGMLAGVGRKR